MLLREMLLLPLWFMYLFYRRITGVLKHKVARGIIMINFNSWCVEARRDGMILGRWFIE